MSPRNTLPRQGQSADSGRPHRLPHAPQRWSRRTAAPPTNVASRGPFALISAADEGTTSRTVLIVDGDDFGRETLGRILEADGYRVSVVADAEAALARVRERPAPELMLLDVLTPGLDGWRSIRRLRGASECQDVPVIVVSALGGPLADGRAGVASYFEKPIAVDALRAEVRRLLPLR